METKKYIINNRRYNISSYNFDLKNSSDEESTIYFSEDFGIMLIYNDGWLMMESIFEYGEESNLLVQEIINDTTNKFPLINRTEVIKTTVANSKS